MSTRFKPKDANTPITAEWLNSVDDLILMNLPASIAAVQANLTAFQVSLANTASPSEGAALIGRGIQTAATFAELRTFLKTSASDQALALARAVPGDGGYGHYRLDPADTTTADDNWFTLVAADGGRWKRLTLVHQTTTTATDVSTSKIERTTSHSGGAPGFVNSALKVTSTVGNGVTNFEWGITSVMDNFAGTGENVAIYAQGNKRAVGPTWAMVAEAKDHTNLANPVGALVGLEVDVFANGTDTNNSRIGIDIVAGKGVGAGATAQIYSGIRIVPSGLDPTQAYYMNGVLFQGDQTAAINISTTGANTTWGIRDNGDKPVGIELSAAYSAAAIRMATGNKLAFDTTGNVYLQESAGILSVTGSFLNLKSSFGMPSSGNTSSTATAGAAGALPATVAGYVIFKIDGVNFKFPYYGA